MAYEAWKGFDKLHWKEQKFLVMNCNPDVKLAKADQKKFDRIIQKGKRLSVMKGNPRAGKRTIKKRKNKKRR